MNFFHLYSLLFGDIRTKVILDTALHLTVATVWGSSVSWLGCVGGIQCESVVCILALPTGAHHEPQEEHVKVFVVPFMNICGKTTCGTYVWQLFIR